MKASTLLTVLMLSISACDSPTSDTDAAVPDAAVSDSGSDAGVDSSTLDASDASDFGRDASTDAPTDATNDAPDTMPDGGPTVVGPQMWDGAMSSEGVCTPDGFCVRTPLPSGLDLHDIWAASANDVWVSGGLGTLAHWDGSLWTGVTGVGGDVVRIDGCSASDIWAVDSGRVALADAGEDEDTSSFEPRLLHWDGSAWLPSGPSAEVLDVECRASNDVWAAAQDGLYHYDGTTWTQIDLGVDVILQDVTADDSQVYTSGLSDGQRVAAIWDGSSATLRYGVPVINDLLIAFDTCWAASQDGVLRWTGTEWETVYGGGAGAFGSLAHTTAGLWAEAATSGLSAFGGETSGSWSQGAGTQCGDEGRSRVHRVGDELWAATPQAIGQEQPRCALQHRPLEEAPTESWDNNMTRRSAAGTLVAPDVFVSVRGDEILTSSNTVSQVVATLPDDGPSFPAFSFVGYDADEGIWASRTDLAIRFDGRTWERFPSDGRLWKIVGDSAAAFGITLDGTVLRWTPADGWTPSTDGARELYRYEDDTWLVDVNQDVRWFNGTDWVNFGHTIDGVDVDIVALIGFGGPGGVWVQTEGTFAISRLFDRAWTGVVRRDELPAWVARYSDFMFGGSGDELWGPGIRWNGSEWISFSAAIGWELDDVFVDHGQLWIFVSNNDGYALRRNL